MSTTSPDSDDNIIMLDPHELNGSHGPISLAQLIADNKAPDCDPLSEEIIESLRALQIGERAYDMLRVA